MTTHRIVALAVAFTMATGAAQTALYAAGQQTATVAGTAKAEARKPYPEKDAVQARATGGPNVGMVYGPVDLNEEGNFTIPNLTPGNYAIELIRKDNMKIVCTEGPFDMTQIMLKNDVVIDCGKVPAAWWLLGAAAAAGITAGILAANASPSQ